ncbi:MAG: hypothetical protein L3K01_06425 [Thermoplasmata archaeon]|nr:hypothetical protein [Thermoplasmata archaeon]
MTAPTNLPPNVELAFEDAVLTLGANVNMFQAGGKSHLRFTGRVRFDGGKVAGFAGFGFLLNGCSDVLFDWTCQVSQFPADSHKFLINCNPLQGTTPGRNLTLRGRTVTLDSTVLRAMDYAQVEVSGVESGPGGRTATVPLAPVAIFSDGLAGPIGGINVHDCRLDGGGMQKMSGLVRVIGALGAGNIVGVRCTDLQLGNMIPVPSDGLADGLDVARCTDVVISRVTGGRCCDLVSCMSSRAVVSDCVAEDCNGIGILVGDGASQTESIADIVVRNCVATNCGRGLRYVNASGIGVAASPGTTTDRVTFENCRSHDTTGSAQKYGFGFGTNGTITNVRILGGEYSGFGEAILHPTGKGLQLRGVAGIPDSG